MNSIRIRQALHNFAWGENNRANNSIRHFRQLRAGASLLNSTQTFAVPNPARVWGIDISGRWDGNVNFVFTYAEGATFVIIKCIDGTVPTRLWRENRARALAAGLLVGEYAWLYPDNKVNCREQARAAWELIRNEPKQIPLCIDFEWTRYAGVSADPNYADLDKWATEFTRLSGYKPGFYSAAGFMNKFGPMPRSLREKFAYFWVANYGVSTPTMPLGFLPDELQFWQFAATGEAAVVAPNDTGKLETDLNYWNGDLASLKALAGITDTGGEVIPPQPEEGNTMTKGTVKAGYALVIRDAVGADTGKRLAAGDVVHGAVTGGRIYFSEIYRLGVTREATAGNAATCNPSNPAELWMVLEDAAPEPEPEPVVFPPRIGLTIGSETRYYVPE